MLNKIFSALSCFSLLVNIFATPISVYAQESPTLTPTDQTTPTDSPTLTPTPTIEESSVPTPTEAASPSPEATVEPTATPEEATPAPTSEPEVQGTASENAQPQAPPSESPTFSPTSTPEEPSENSHVSAVILENAQVDTSSIDQFDLIYQEDGSATITTDKLDYSPTDTVLITGTGFIANKTYTIEITSQNSPAVDFKDNIKADGKGNILYNYQLDGNYRPNYKVEIKDGSVIVASTKFTDSPPSGCSNDSAGANDLPGQKDLSKMCANYSGLPTSVGVSWDWDDASFSGGNTGDACALFDTNGNGKANYAVCVQVGGNPGSYITKFVYSCDDSSSTNCLGSVALSPSGGTTCSANVQATDPFPGPPNSAKGSDYPNDTVASCTINLSDVGGGTATLTDVCSYPSASTPSNASDCILFKSSSGKIEVVKVLSPSNDSGLFNLQVDGTTYAANVGNGGDTGEQVVSVANHTVGETAGTGTSLSDYTSSIVCKDTHGTGSVVATTGTNPWTLAVADQKDILCTITNTRNQGTLVVHKTFTDQTTHNPVTINITGIGSAQGTTDGSGDATFNNLTPGTYSATAVEPSGYYQSGTTCTNVSVTSGNTANCTITDSPILGTITVHKTIVGTSTAYSNFCFTLSPDPGNGQVCANVNGDAVFTNVPAGTYTASETASALNYSQTGTTCNSNMVITNNGDSQSCTVTNTRDTGDLQAIKEVDDQSDLTQWSFSLDGGASVQADETGLVDFGQVTTGESHTITESGPSGYHFVSISGANCNPDGSTAFATVAKNDATVCTFNNARDTGSITVHKMADSDGDGQFETGDSGANTLGFRWGIDQETPEHLMGGTASPLPTGPYSVNENSIDGYHFVGWYYTGGDGGSCEEPEDTSLPDGISVSEGETTEITLCNARDTNTINVNKVLLDPDGNPIDNDSHSFTIQLDGAGDQNIQNGGQVSYNDVPTGVHGITEVADSEYGELGCKIGDTDASSFTLSTGDPVSVVCTNKQKKSHITVIKRIVGPKGEDVLDENGQFTFNVSTQSAVLGDNGEHTFDVNPGNYNVVEEANGDYTFDTCSAEYDGKETGESIENGENVTLGSNDTVFVTCTNKQDPTTITGLKWNDQNANGQRDVLGEETLEPGLPDWTIFIDNNRNGIFDSEEVSTTTNQDGTYAFEGLNPGTYRVCEVQQGGWQETHPIDSETNNCYDVTLTSNETSSGWNFGNSELASSVKIEKSNNKSGGTSAGDTVAYTLTLTNDGKQTLANIEISDVLPGGFSYVPGSTTGATTSDPVVSGGVLKWSGLGPLSPDGTLTINYKAKIASDLVDGTYTNFATCKSINRREDEVDCNVADSSVPLGHGIGYGGNLTPQVLGASTELPASGSPTGLLILAFGALAAGLVLRKRYEKN